MKVPHSVVGRTRISNQPAGYLQAADMTGLGEGLSRGLGAVGKAFEAREARQDQFKRFKTLSDFSEFETGVTERLTEMKRNADVDISNFPEQAEGVFDNEQAAWLNNIPAELQPEFQFRTNQLKQNVVADAMKFQFESQDAFFTQEVRKQYDNARLSLEEDPSSLPQWESRLVEFLEETDLPEFEKAQLAREFNIGMQMVVYKQERVQNKVANANLAPNSPTAPLAATLIMDEEGFRTNAYSDKRASTGEHDAWRVGYGSDTVTRADGTVETVTPNTVITKADAERDLARRLKEFESTAARQTGVEQWASLPVNTRAALTSVAYNYGSLPSSVVSAVATGDNDQIASAVESLSSNKERRAREAAVIRGETLPEMDLDQDPRFNDLPYDTRVALRADADREAARILSDQASQEKEIHDQRLNGLLNDIIDGNAGMNDINQAYNGGNGWLTDYDDRRKAINAWEDANEKLLNVTKGQEKLSDDTAIWDPTSTDDKKLQNALFNQRGPEALANHDENYMRGLAAMAARTRDIPTDAIGTLTGMSRSNDPARANFAYNSLAMLREQAPEAFDHRVGDDLASRVEYWQARKDTMPEEELHQMLKGGTTTAERQQRLQLRQEAQDLLEQRVDKVPQAEGLVNEFVERFDPYFGSAPNLYGVPWAAKGLNRDFQTAFVDEYERYGDLEEAKEAAFKQLGRTWGTTTVGGIKTLMRLPPEKAGYKEYGGSFAWIDNQVREELGLTDEQFQLISDEQTDQEFDTWRRNPDAPPPSYQVAIKTDRGWQLQLRDQENEITGSRVVPTRLNFQPQEQELEQERQTFERRNLQERRREIVNMMEQRVQRERIVQTESGPKLQSNPEYEALEEELQTVEEALKGFEQEPPVESQRRGTEERLRRQRNATR